MARWTSRTARAASLHRRATAVADAAAAALDAVRPAPADPQQQYDIAERLRKTAELLAPGWLAADLDAPPAHDPAPDLASPMFVRIGTAKPLDDAGFPVLVPVLGVGHVSIDTDARDARVRGMLRALLLRLLAAAPAGSLLVRAVDGAGTGVFAPFDPLRDAGLLPPPALDQAGLRAVLAEAEQWVAPAAHGRPRRHDRTLLLVIAALPAPAEATDLARIVSLAEQGPAAGLHLVVAGWPPPPGSAEAPRPPLPHTTTVTLRSPYAVVGDPPGGTFGRAGAPAGSGGLNSPVFLDPDPAAGLVDRLCRDLARRIDDGAHLRLVDLLPEVSADAVAESRGAADGLVTTVGYASGRPVSLGFTDLTPHWMVGGRPGSGKTAFLTNVLLGLAARYGPSDLAVYLVDLGEGESFAEYLQTERDPTWLPQVRAAGMQADREYVLSVLAELDEELDRRVAACRRAGVSRFAELREREPLPRIVCVIENFPLLTAERDRLADEAADRLESLAHRSRAYGIHLVLAGDGPLGVSPGPTRRVLGQFPVRVALPGGGAVLAPTNDAAAGLPLGTAVVNTAGGLGGPRGATRGHERMVRFPDPHADPETIADLRERLWSARPPGSAPPVVFAGYARPRLGNDPAYRAALAGRAEGPPAALLGRAVDVRRSPVAFPLGPAPGRHLAVLGRDAGAARLLAGAARTLAVHCSPGAARFLVAPLVAGTDRIAAALVAELGQRHRAALVDRSGLTAALGQAEPTYLIVFGMDPPDPAELPVDRLREVLRDGPAQGVHLLCWWRDARPLTASLGEAVAEGELAGIVALGADPLVALPGEPVERRVRGDRALLRDLHSGRATLLVPYAEWEVW